MIFLIYTGARVGEALWLDWREVDLQRGHVVFLKTKNGEANGVPLPQRVVDALMALPQRKEEVFRRPDGLPYQRPEGDDEENRSADLRASKRRLEVRVDVPRIKNFHPHDCRHVFATWHYSFNRDLTALMRLGGWRDIKSVMRYTHANVDELRNTMDRLPGGNLGEPIKAKPEVIKKSNA